jgi:drug/metabolite transporter (DMT)-like permease
MFAVLLAALSSVSYGASDFSGAVASRRSDAAAVTVAAQIVSLVVLSVLLLVVPPEVWLVSDLVWGAAAGVCVAIALTAFYRALEIGPMTRAAATTALVGASVPLVAGLSLGERPGAVTLMGVGIAIVAAVLVSAGGTSSRSLLRLAPRERFVGREHAGLTTQLSVVSGLGFGLFFVLLSRASSDAGVFPLVGARAASVVVLLVVLVSRRRWGRPNPSSAALVVAAGGLDCAANVLYLAALHRGELVWVAAITSLYPVSTVALAWVMARGKISRSQLVGMGLAVTAIALILVER